MTDAIQVYQDNVALAQHVERDIEAYVKAELMGDSNLVAAIRGNWTLLKPGAQKLASRARVSPVYETLHCERDHQTPMYYFEQKCRLFRDGVQVGEGEGAFLSETVGKRKADANFAKKMANKRAFVDAVLTLFGISHIFTQDLEDTPTAQAPAAPPLTRSMEDHPFTRESAAAFQAYFQMTHKELLTMLGVQSYSDWDGTVRNARGMIDMMMEPPETPEEAAEMDGGVSAKVVDYTRQAALGIERGVTENYG